ncbi:hypothetical protein TTRE_0000215301 [Trichuris trichiura]|uniref:Glycine N-acyltransferase-like protein n=1 Tax=Trichuris trichiura TaxID=36087 RepID=A0A077Z1U0_TRITR|nr:hypothetical protein TTRE_0000215301 [Trichuris trichiura]
MHRLSTTFYPALRNLAQKHLPRTVALYNLLTYEMNIEKNTTCADPLLLFADSWPEPNIVLLEEHSRYNGVKDYPSFYAFPIARKIPRKTIDSVSEAFFLPSFQTYGEFLLYHLPVEDVPTLNSLLRQSETANVSMESESITDLFWISPEYNEMLTQLDLALPNNFVLSELHPHEAEFVDSFWPYRYDGSVDLIRRVIERRPNVCLRTGAGNLVGWAMVNDKMSDEMHLYTLSQFRQQKVATLIEVVLAKKIISKNCIPYKCVVPQNRLAAKFTSKSVLWKSMDMCIDWLRVLRNRK